MARNHDHDILRDEELSVRPQRKVYDTYIFTYIFTYVFTYNCARVGSSYEIVILDKQGP
jgi:hypothetical protein